MGLAIDHLTLKENVILAPYTTFKIGGPAFNLVEAEKPEDIAEAVKWAKENYYPFVILGGGSNILFSDKGFPGLVIKNGISFIGEPKGNILEAGSGTFFGGLIMTAAKAGFEGLEWAIGIPGTLGGAICGNAGAFGHATGEVVRTVKVLEEDGRIQVYHNKQCRFGYRDSIFKHKNCAIISAELEFRRQNPEAIQEHMTNTIKIRPSAPPYPSAGSVFKNIEWKNINSYAQKLIPGDKVKGGKVPTGYLIEACGLKGLKVGGAQVWENHCNYVVNVGVARAEDVMEVINLCKKAVNEKFGIKLEEEIQLIGF